MNNEHYRDPTAEKCIDSPWTVTKIVPDWRTEKRDARMRKLQDSKAERKKKEEEQHKEKIKRQNLLLREKALMLEKMNVNLEKLEQMIDKYPGIVDPAESRQRKQIKSNVCEFIRRYEVKVNDILVRNGGV